MRLLPRLSKLIQLRVSVALIYYYYCCYYYYYILWMVIYWFIILFHTLIQKKSLTISKSVLSKLKVHGKVSVIPVYMHMYLISMLVVLLYTFLTHTCTASEIKEKLEDFGVAAVKTQVKCEGQCVACTTCTYSTHTVLTHAHIL